MSIWLRETRSALIRRESLYPSDHIPMCANNSKQMADNGASGSWGHA